MCDRLKAVEYTQQQGTHTHGSISVPKILFSTINCLFIFDIYLCDEVITHRTDTKTNAMIHDRDV